MKRRRISLFFTLAGLLAILGASPVAMAKDKDKDEGVELKATLRGFEEVNAPAGAGAVSTGASGSFSGEISSDGTSITYTLSYTGLEGDVRQAHIHLGQRGVTGNIVVFLCQTTANPDPTTHAPTCPQSGTVSATLTKANVTNRADAQGIESTATQGSTDAEFAEFVTAIRAGVTYANVHSANAGGVATKFNSGEIRGQIKAHDD